MPKPIVHLVVLGEFHRDPASFSILRQLLASALARHQAVVFADEDEPSSTLASKLKGNEAHLEICHSLIRGIPEVAGRIKKDLYRPYFPFVCRADFTKLFLARSFSQEIALQWSESLMGYASWPQRIALWKFLMKEGIRSHSIDIDAKTRIGLFEPGRFKEMECTRIVTMAKNIKTTVEASMPNGGMMFISIGMNHIKNLTAALRMMFSQESAFPFEIMIDPVRLVSDYTRDGLADHEVGLTTLYSSLTPDIQAHYDKIAVLMESCAEDAHTGEFHAPILNRLGSAFYTAYRIPDCDVGKRGQLRNLYANIAEEHADGSVTAYIHSAYLVASVRRLLGIDRYRLRLKSDDAAERIKDLEDYCPQMTIEKAVSDDTYLVTFPTSDAVKAHLQIISDDQQWGEYKTARMGSGPGLSST